MGNKQSNEARDEQDLVVENEQNLAVENEQDLDAVKSHDVKTKMQIRGIQSLFSSVYLTIQETLANMSLLKEQADFVQMENIDLCQALKGTVFKTNLNNLCDVYQITNNIKARFDELQCDYCDQQAQIASECSQETTYKLYCKTHFKEFGSYIQHSINLEHSKEFNCILLNELEKHLVRIQERIDYFHIKNDKKDPILYEKVNRLIEKDFEDLKFLLESLTDKCLKISQIKAKTNKMKYEYLSFIKDDCDKCRNTIFNILSMIPKVCDKIETDSLIQVIVDSNEGVPLEEETKENITPSISDSIYGKEYTLIHIPTQSLKCFKEFENKIKKNCKITESCIKVLKKYGIYSN